MDNCTYAQVDKNTSCFLAINCFTFLSGRQLLPRRHLLTAGIFSLTLIPFVVVANILLLSHLRKKQNVPRNFRRLLQVLSITDLFVGGIVLPTHGFTLLMYPSNCHCGFELLAQFSAAMFGGSSGRTTVMIAFEQSVHIKSMTTHPFLETKLYKMLICTAGPAVSLVVAVAVTVGSRLNLYPQISGAFTILDIIFLGAVVFLYLSAYHSVHRHIIETNLRVSRKLNYNRMFAKKVTRIICVLVICYGPFILTNLLLSFFSQSFSSSVFRLVNIWSYNIVYVNSFLNAVVFLCKKGLFGNRSRQDKTVLGLKVVRRGSSSRNIAYNNKIFQSLSINKLECSRSR